MQSRYPAVWMRLGLFAVAGVIAGVITAYAVKPDYLATSNGQFYFKDTDSMHAYMQQLLSRRNLVEIIAGENLFQQERQRLPLEDIIEAVRKMIRVTGEGPAYRLEVHTADPYAARRIVERLTNSGQAIDPVPVRPFVPL